MTAAKRPLWTCPRCGNRFVTRNLWHSCVRVSVREHLAGRPREVVRLYREVARAVRSCGPGVRSVSSRSRTGWMVRTRFAGVEFRRDHVRLSFWLKREVSSPRLRSTHLRGDDWIYALPVRSAAELDDELRGWLCEAYLVGRQEAGSRRPGTSGRGARRGPRDDAPSRASRGSS